MAKETAVEWLVHELDKQMIERDKFDAFDWIFEDLIKEAKEMERTQIVKAYDKGEFNSGVNETSEQYYVKTYK